MAETNRAEDQRISRPYIVGPCPVDGREVVDLLRGRVPTYCSPNCRLIAWRRRKRAA